MTFDLCSSIPNQFSFFHQKTTLRALETILPNHKRRGASLNSCGRDDLAIVYVVPSTNSIIRPDQAHCIL